MEWKDCLFDDFVKLNRGFDLPNDQIVEGDYPVVASTSIKAYHNEWKTKGPGVVTGRSGSLGTVQYIKGNFWPLNTSLYVKDFKGNDPLFVYYFLQIMHLENFNAGAGVPTLNQNHLHKIKIRIPNDVEDQKKIASILVNYEELIETNYRRIQMLEDTASELYKEWFIRMRFPGYKKAKFVNGIPNDWKEKRIDSVAFLSAGGDRPRSFSVVSTSDYSIPVYSNGITDDGLYGFTNEAVIKKESVTVSARGTIGYVALHEEPYTPIVRLIVLQPKTDTITAKFLYHLLKNTSIMGTGASQEQLTVPDFSKKNIIVPTSPLINAFTDIISPLYIQKAFLKKQNLLLALSQQLLLPRLMSGNLSIE